MSNSDREQFVAVLQRMLDDWSLRVSGEAIETMWRHFELLVAANRRFNLTRITDAATAAVLHYADSLIVWRWVRQNRVPVQQVLDVGTGGGFPAVPLAIVCPQWSVTAIDSTGKKVRFVEEAAATLGLANLRAVHARAGEWRPQNPRRFHLVLGRAIGPLEKALQAASSLIAPRGQVLLHKTLRQCEGERKRAMIVARRRGLQEGPRLDYRLTIEGEPREYALVSFRKT
jgi:16S rRNA (guanine527-N7)-methyltransferase